MSSRQANQRSESAGLPRAEPAAGTTPAIGDAERFHLTDPQRSRAFPWRALGGVMTLVWVVGFLVQLTRLVHGWWAVLRERRLARPIENEGVGRMLAAVCEDVGLRRVPQLGTRSHGGTPMVTGTWHPLILLPKGWFHDCRQDALRHVLLHECAHVVRGDVLVGAVQRLVAVVFWPHPAVHMLNRELARAREETCDNFVLFRADARSYSSTLLALATGIEEAWLPRPGVGLFAKVWQLEDRVAGLLHRQRRRGTRANKWSVASLAAILAVLVGVMACIGPAVAVSDADSPQSGRTTGTPPGRAPPASDTPSEVAETPLSALLRLKPWLTFDNQDRLIGIDLSSKNATDADLARLAAFPHIEELLLADTRITDEGMAHLRHLSGLTYLDLSQTKVTRRGLADLTGLDDLKLIRLENTTVTQDEIDDLGLPGDLALPLEEDIMGFGGGGGGFFEPEDPGGVGGFFPREADDGERRGGGPAGGAANPDASGDGIAVDRE